MCKPARTEVPILLDGSALHSLVFPGFCIGTISPNIVLLIYIEAIKKYRVLFQAGFARESYVYRLTTQTSGQVSKLSPGLLNNSSPKFFRPIHFIQSPKEYPAFSPTTSLVRIRACRRMTIMFTIRDDTNHSLLIRSSGLSSRVLCVFTSIQSSVRRPNLRDSVIDLGASVHSGVLYFINLKSNPMAEPKRWPLPLDVSGPVLVAKGYYMQIGVW